MVDSLKGIVIGLDVDEVCAQMLKKWVRLINETFGCNINYRDIDAWDVSKFVPQGAIKASGLSKNEVYQILALPGFYDDVEPLESYVTGVSLLRRLGAEIYYVSSCVPGTMDMKMEWLTRHDKKFDWKNCFFAHRKDMISLDVLVDDAPHNLQDAPETIATVRMRAPYNVGVVADAHVSSWNEMPQAILSAYVNTERYAEEHSGIL